MRIKGGDDNVGIERVASSGSGDGPGLQDGRGEGFRAVPRVSSGQPDEEEEQIR